MALTKEQEIALWYTGTTIPDPKHPIPLVDRSRLDPELRPTEVDYTSGHKPGTIVVDVEDRFLYHVQPGGRAVRYGVGVGRDGFSYNGVARIGRKAEWPNWTPTANMVRLKPELARYAEGGLSNPLGARSLYLYSGDRDTMFRIHGTNEPWTIGEQYSSGCIRLLNEDIVELYDKVPVGTTVIVKRGSGARKLTPV